MYRLVFIFALAAVGSCGSADYAHAQLFGRRGHCSTGHCFTPHVAHAPAIVKAPDHIQTFVFNNVANPLSLDPRGDTLYGVSRALEYNSPSSALYLDIARRSLDVASEMGGNARGVDADILEAMKVEARGRAVSEAFRALREDTTTTSTSSTTRITLKNGLPVFEEAPLPRGLDSISCLKCHAPGASAAAKFVIDDTYNLDKHMQAEAAIASGAMPPKANLSDVEKAQVRLQLSRLVP